MRATWKSVLWLFVGGFAVAVMWLLGAVAAHAQPTCTDSWANAVSGQWNTASNWSQNRVPASTDDVCITVPGTYTVTLNGGGSAGMLNLGAGSTTSGTQTLDVQGTASGTASNLTLSTSTGSDVALGGVLELDSQQGAGAGTAELGGGSGVTLVNDGTFETLDATNNSDQIAVNLTNDSGGKVSIAGASTDVNGQNAAMTITNSGSFTVTSAGDLSLNEGSNFTDKAGTLVNDGTMTVSGTFTQSGGVESANAVQFQENATLADSAGAGSFSFLANSGAFLSGTIPASQTVTVTGNSTTSAAANLTGNVTNDGTFVLDADGGSASLSGGSGVTFTNKGTFETEGTSTSVPDQIATELTNDSGGTVSIAAPDTGVNGQNAAMTITNSGSFTVTSAGALSLNEGSNFTDKAGTLVNDGTMTVSGTFTQSGGMESVDPVQLQENATLADSAGGGLFDFVSTGFLSGTIPAKQTVTVLGSGGQTSGAQLTGGTVTNDGTFVLDALGGQTQLSGGTGQTLDNNGTFETEGGSTSDPDQIAAELTNDSGGTVSIASPDTGVNGQNAAMTITNDGTFAVTPGGQVSLNEGSSFVQASSGTYQATIDVGTAVTAGLVNGPVDLAGTLAIDTIGSPTLGTTYPVIGPATVSGSFTNTSFGPDAYNVTETASSLSVTVATPPSVTAQNLSATQDIPNTNVTVATITNGSQSAPTYTASILWGDGTAQTKGTVTSGEAVTGSHTYGTPGTYTITTTVSDQFGTTVTATSTAQVAAAPTPTVTASSPKTVYQATTATLTLTGTGFTADATSSASFSDAGITVSSMTWLSSTQLSVSVAVASTATTGAGNVSVTTPGGTGTCTGCLNVDKPPPPSNTALPVISGTAQDGQALTTSNGTWSSKNTLTYAYQWQLCNSSGADCANILGATNDYFRLSSLDVGNEVTVVVTATDQVSQSTGATASPIGPVADPPPPSNTALPVISGTAQDGRVLTTSKGSWSSPDTLTYAYQWQLCNSSGTDCATILGATNDYFRLSTVDVGNKVTVVVTASDQEHQSTEASAGPIGPVTDPPPPSNTALPVISGTAQDGQVLTVSNGSWSSPDSLSYGFQWQLCNSSGTDCAPIVGATENYFQLAAADVGGDVTVVVTASDQEHQSTEASAGPIGPVTDPPPPSNSGPPVISGGTQAGDVVAASSGTWNSPDTLTYAYQWQLCNSSGTDCADILGATNDYYQLTSAEVGDEVTVVVTATDQENQSTAATAPASGPVTAA